MGRRGALWDVGLERRRPGLRINACESPEDTNSIFLKDVGGARTYKTVL